jgi:hypothetical protein
MTMRSSRTVLSLRGWKFLLCAAGVLVCVGALGGCVGKPEVKHVTGSRMSPSIDQVLRAHREEWLAIPGVVGTAIGLKQGKPCILVLVAHRTKEVGARIPRKVDGYPVVIEESGRFRALPAR